MDGMKFGKVVGISDKPIRWAHVYKANDGENVIEGTVPDLVKHFGFKSSRSFVAAIQKATKKNNPIRYKGITFIPVYVQTTERIYEVVLENGKKVGEGTVKRLAARYGYPVATISTYCSNRHYMVIRRKKYYFRPLDKWSILWTRLD